MSCFNDAQCTDVEEPGTGATCPSCPTGYNGDGLLCTGKLCTIMLVAFFMLFFFLVCVDIDECSVNNANCTQFCNNTLGSFQCTCMSGFELASDGFTCNGKTMNSHPIIIHNSPLQCQILMNARDSLMTVSKSVQTPLALSIVRVVMASYYKMMAELARVWKRAF